MGNKNTNYNEAQQIKQHIMGIYSDEENQFPQLLWDSYIILNPFYHICLLNEQGVP